MVTATKAEPEGLGVAGAGQAGIEDFSAQRARMRGQVRLHDPGRPGVGQ